MPPSPHRMFRQLFSLFGFCLIALPLPGFSIAIPIVAHDSEHNPVPGVIFTSAGIDSLPTNAAGATQLDLPAGHESGRQIDIDLVNPPATNLTTTVPGKNWILVTHTISVPSSKGVVEVVLVSRSSLHQIATQLIDDDVADHFHAQPTRERDRKEVLADAAKSHGLTPEQLDIVIASVAQSPSPIDRGIAAFLKGQYLESEKLFTEASTHERNDPLGALLYLGTSQFEEGKLEEAASTFKRAFALNPENALLANARGQTFLRLGNLNESERLFRLALVLDEKKYGAEHPRIAKDLRNLAALLQASGRPLETQLLMRRALAIDEKWLGPEAPEVARDLNILATLLQSEGRISEAERLMRRALTIDTKRLGPAGPDVARDLNNLAALLQVENRLSESNALMKQALIIDKERFGADDPDVARDLNNLAALYQTTNRLSEAEALMRRALAIDEKWFGPEHRNVARDLSTLAALLQASHRTSTAEPLMRRALAIDERSLGSAHPEVTKDRNMLSLLLQATESSTVTTPLVRRAVASYGHPLARDLNNLAILLQATNRHAEAAALINRAVTISTNNHGFQSTESAIYRRNLVLLHATTDTDRSPGEVSARALLDQVQQSLRAGNLFWKHHLDMKQGLESTVEVEINEASKPFFMRGAFAPTAHSSIQTSSYMAAELLGDSDEFTISPEGPVPHPLLGGKTMWVWTVKPLIFGHGKELHLLLYLRPTLTDQPDTSYPLMVQQADIDVAISPAYIFKIHEALILGTGGGGGLLGALAQPKVRSLLLRLLSGGRAGQEPENDPTPTTSKPTRPPRRRRKRPGRPAP